MLVKLLGIVIFVRLEHHINALWSMLVTPLAIVMLPDFPSGQQINSVPSFESNKPSTLLYAVLSVATVIDVRLEQNSNAESPMLVTLLGIVILVRLEQS